MEEMCSKLAEVWPQECLINGHPGQLGELRYGLGRECQGRLHNCWALWLSLCDFQHWQLPDGAVSVVLCTWKMHVTVPSAAVDYGCSALLLEGRGAVLCRARSQVNLGHFGASCVFVCLEQNCRLLLFLCL